MPHNSMLTFWLGWFAGCFAMSLVSGWWQMAGRFPARENAGKRWYFVSGSVRRYQVLPIQYHATFFLTLCDDGLALSVFFPVRFMHPPLFLPWMSLTGITSRRFLFFFEQSEVDIENGAFRLRIRGQAGRALREAYAMRQERVASSGAAVA